MHYDAAIIGAGMSGLAAGIRLAYFGKRVCILERHEVYGGLNSFYTLGGRQFDVGLHAVTNYVPPGVPSAPLNKLLRQLRLTRDDLALRPQKVSEIRFPERCLRFSNDVGLLTEEVARLFPGQREGFAHLLTNVREFADTAPDPPRLSARKVFGEHLTDPLLVDMLLCPLMYYGSAGEHDMDFAPCATLFKAVYLEGLARPLGGVRVILKALVKKFRACGGKLRTRCGVRCLESDGQRVTALVLDSGECVTADVVFSSAGLFETMRLTSDRVSPPPNGLRDAGRYGESPPACGQPGRLSFVESISCLDTAPAELGLESSIVFFNDAPRFTYARPDGLVDTRSGVVCCPNNFEGHAALPEGIIRLTSLANYDAWTALGPAEYAAAKSDVYDRAVDRATRFIPEFRHRVVFKDVFTPRTVEKYTGHINGAVYGAPHKVRDGRTRLNNLFICGTDQGLLGIVGAMLSGITMVNRHVFGGG